MIYLVLAEPRTGKSQYAVSLGMKAKAEGKRVFVTNFHQTEAQREATGFELYGDDGVWPKEGRADFTGDISKWWDEIPHGSVWIIDEVQQVIPQRGKDKPVQDWVKQLSLHGHHDLTIYLLTQDGMQMDVTARRNCNFTLILSRPLGLARCNVYTFRKFQTLPDDAWRRSQALKSAESKNTFKYAKKYQDAYVSASAHEHIKRRLPKKLLLLPVLVVVVAGLLWFAWTRLKAQSAAPSESNPTTGAVAGALTGATAPSAGSPVLSVDAYVDQWKPRIADVPASAPAYDGFKVQDYPRLACYISSRFNECRCVTAQQGTKVAISQTMCRTYVQDGMWDPYKAPVVDSGQGATPPEGAGVSPAAMPPDGGAVPVRGTSAAIGSVAPYGASGIGAY